MQLLFEHEKRPGSPFEFRVTCFPLKRHSEFAIVSDDAPGLLAAITGALAANRVSVLEAIVGCRSEEGGRRVAFDLFKIIDAQGP